MPDYRRMFVPGGEYFFTVNLEDRSSDLLVRRIDAFRAAWRYVEARAPFETFEEFAAANLDLFNGVLEKYYSKETLASDLARRTFLMPEV